MHLLCLLLVAGSSLAYYSGQYNSRNFIIREEPISEDDMKDLVQCPVCTSSDSWDSRKEVCPIVIGKKTYKRCKLGKYINYACDGRMDCYRGPGEECTEKRNFDTYGLKCAHGYECNKFHRVCIGLNHQVDSTGLALSKQYPFYFRRISNDYNEQSDDNKYRFEGTPN